MREGTTTQKIDRIIGIFFLPFFIFFSKMLLIKSIFFFIYHLKALLMMNNLVFISYLYL
ncbi:uncharacterized protein BX664DRAFT_113857 [Halteromyces radiatus]|uniref:uncharacterized protein n=1 Tax=Halteromyces radiatus TaxID=101107 RepID=UPI00221FC667|nr:uncharacterized protein BX664DRAFT_113857 [Halteromyces radiatus]KAI8093762.1 hypothetical protein BX664DRAFT_113857 [Halteromyces radiatus]